MNFYTTPRQPYKPLADSLIKRLLDGCPKPGRKLHTDIPKPKWGERKLVHSEFSTDYNHNLP